MHMCNTSFSPFLFLLKWNNLISIMVIWYIFTKLLTSERLELVPFLFLSFFALTLLTLICGQELYCAKWSTYCATFLDSLYSTYSLYLLDLLYLLYILYLLFLLYLRHVCYILYLIFTYYLSYIIFSIYLYYLFICTLFYINISVFFSSCNLTFWLPINI